MPSQLTLRQVRCLSEVEVSLDHSTDSSFLRDGCEPIMLLFPFNGQSQSIIKDNYEAMVILINNTNY